METLGVQESTGPWTLKIAQLTEKLDDLTSRCSKQEKQIAEKEGQVKKLKDNIQQEVQSAQKGERELEIIKRQQKDTITEMSIYKEALQRKDTECAKKVEELKLKSEEVSELKRKVENATKVHQQNTGQSKKTTEELAFKIGQIQVCMKRYFLAALSSSRSLVVGPLVGRSVGLRGL